MFAAAAAPYQILDESVHFRHVDGELDLEIVWGFHSWRGDVIWSFINKGRAVEGGTHDQGLAAALRSLRTKPGVFKPQRSAPNGIIAIMSILYPGAVWEGCLKARLGSKELRPLVRKTVVEQSLRWLDAHEPARQQLREIQPFQFADLWTTSR
jgi:DNA gyrase/topoisomerase IV subunit B